MDGCDVWMRDQGNAGRLVGLLGRSILFGRGGAGTAPLRLPFPASVAGKGGFVEGL